MRKIINTGKPLRDRLIAFGICIDCQLQETVSSVRCPKCAAKHNKAQRKRYRARPTTPRLLLRRKIRDKDKRKGNNENNTHNNDTWVSR